MTRQVDSDEAQAREADDARLAALRLVQMVELGRRGRGESVLVKEVERRCAVLTGLPATVQESGLTLNYTMGDVDGVGAVTSSMAGTQRRRVPLGLHLDIHNGKPRRAVTVLAYLNTVCEGGGGETVFPCALPQGCDGDEGFRALRQGCPSPCARAREAGQALLTEGCTHTAAVSWQGPRATEAAATLLEAAQGAGDDGGLCVQPRKGLAVIFATRRHSVPPSITTLRRASCPWAPPVDPMSWHAGTALEGKQHAKWTIQKFKELPRGMPLPHL